MTDELTPVAVPRAVTSVLESWVNSIVARRTADDRADIIALDAITITDAATFEAAGLALQKVNGEAKRLDDHRKMLVAPLLDAKRAIDAAFQESIQPREEAVAKAKRSIATYTEQERRARLEAERLQREAAAAEAARLRAESEAAMAKGDLDTAVERNFEAEMVAQPIAPVQVARVSGISTRTTWSAEVADKVALIKAAAANPEAYAQYLAPDEKAIGAAVRAQKERFNVPGITVRQETGIAAGRR